MGDFPEDWHPTHWAALTAHDDEVIDHVWANEALPLPKLDVAWTI